MPTIDRPNGFRVLIHTNDHPPAHVHVRNADGEVRIALGDEDAAPWLMSRRGMRDPDARKALEIVEAKQTEYLADWEAIHGM